MLKNFWNRRKRIDEPPAFWQTYERRMKAGPDRRLPIEEVPFVVFDTETTGLDTKKDRILSIGAVVVRNWRIDLRETFEQGVRQPSGIAGPDSIPVHGILPVDREGYLSEEEAIAAFIGYLGPAVLVGHHVRFDIAMLNQILRRMGLGKLRNSFLDTARLARRIQGGAVDHGPVRSPGLDELCRRHGIPPVDRHTAAGDAYLTAILFLKLAARLQQRQVKNLRDLLR